MLPAVGAPTGPEYALSMIRGGLAALLVLAVACGKNGDQRPTTAADLDSVKDAKHEGAVTMKLAGTVDSAYTAMLASGPGDLWVGANRQGVEIWRGDKREREVSVAGVITELFVADGQPVIVYAAPQVYEIGAQGFRPGAPTPRQLATGVTGMPSGSRYLVERASWSPDGSALFVLAKLGLSRRRGAPGAGTAPGQRLLEIAPDGTMTRAIETVDASGIQRLVASERWLVVAGPALVALDRRDLSRHELAPLHAGNVLAARFSGDGRLFAVATMDGIVHLWRVTDDGFQAVGAWQAQPAGGAPLAGRATALAFDPAHPRLAVGGSGGVIRLWGLGKNVPDAAEAEYVIHDPHDRPIQIVAIAFSADGRLLRASQSHEQKVYQIAIDG